ncbi:MAG TPA: DUF4384 domain-containing protein [Syntrophales bacterium]|nr:DUF4384 domain-containing protein [Syntrophales bacterium]
MTRAILSILICLSAFTNAYAIQSTIMDSEGYACMGEDKSRKQTEQTAMADAKRNAVEYAITYVKSETKVKDLTIEEDMIKAYSNASVKVLEVKQSLWYKDERSGDCVKTKIKAEVIPDEKAVKEVVAGRLGSDNPGLPLLVRIWTDKEKYQKGDRVRIYIKGNKPFYARVLYKDAKGDALQILPNPYRKENYFNGGVIYEIPSGDDRFELEVSPPFGEEHIILYTSTSPLGDISLAKEGGVYQVKTKEKDVGIKTRGVKIQETVESGRPQASEFFEDRMTIKTGR